MLTTEKIRALTGAAEIEIGECVQSLWSGYGEIVRIRLDGNPAIAKHISPPEEADHPRGWNSDRSHQRKLKSYAVENCFYRDHANACPPGCRIAKPIAVSDTLLILEDLDAAGFSARGLPQITPCLQWLAAFHRAFLGTAPAGLWDIGTYWHLATRPDEFAAMPESPLKAAAPAMDAALSSAVFQTLVHGDAKLANFCFSEDGSQVAAVDFQYVGGGPGVKDLAYFLGSVLTDSQCEQEIPRHLDTYFTALARPEVEAEWRTLFPVAWADFHRFLIGWCPGHPKMNDYGERVAREVAARF